MGDGGLGVGQLGTLHQGRDLELVALPIDHFRDLAELNGRHLLQIAAGRRFDLRCIGCRVQLVDQRQQVAKVVATIDEHLLRDGVLEQRQELLILRILQRLFECGNLGDLGIFPLHHRHRQPELDGGNLFQFGDRLAGGHLVVDLTQSHSGDVKRHVVGDEFQRGTVFQRIGGTAVARTAQRQADHCDGHDEQSPQETGSNEAGHGLLQKAQTQRFGTQ